MTEQPLTIRRAQPEDRDAIAKLFDGFGFKEPDPQAWVDYCIRQEKSQMFLGVVQDRPVAFVRVEIRPDNRAIIHQLHTDLPYEGRGIGTVLMKTCENFAYQNNASLILLSVNDKKPELVNFYNRRGYKCHFNAAADEAHKLLVSLLPKEDHFLMTKDLPKLNGGPG